MEYFEHGDLCAALPTIRTEHEAKAITMQLLEGLKIMHEHGFTHRDIKPQVGCPSHWSKHFADSTLRGLHRIFSSSQNHRGGGSNSEISGLQSELRAKIQLFEPRQALSNIRLQRSLALSRKTRRAPSTPMLLIFGR